MFDLTKPADIGQTLLVTLIGMGTVILGLTILIFLIKALIKVTDHLGGKKKKDAAPQVVIPPVKVFGTPAEETVTEEDDSIVAAITAAIVCMMEENQGFVVRRIRRV
ncbi:MAG: OadG family protein [Clostridia bacterium]|nr:OadG family protein [Clostridia bacterium]